MEKRPFYRAATAGLGKYGTGGYGRIGVYRDNYSINWSARWYMSFVKLSVWGSHDPWTGILLLYWSFANQHCGTSSWCITPLIWPPQHVYIQINNTFITTS